ncbi:hypothetical protein THRCLA_08602 [Thraustotheca clavata]|uniref:Cilia- and flagella-associated protein 53 n=1 Tax=Thraustotheca clavata TaxID=74557 RepID=A0A1V9Z4C3_9STRA|nr:hypothetical protein THRCLA_08602 [Thraustotheca clavata]
MAMAGRNPRGAGEGTIMKRRQREDSLAMYGNIVKGFQHMNSRADWETKAHEQNGTRQTLRVLKELKNQDESALHSRRMKLAELYNHEFEMWRQQCMANVETPEERKEKMIARAKELKEKREAERRAYVEEKKLQLYRESCDDIRTVDSAKIMENVVQDRQKQLAERAIRLEQEKVYDAQMTALWAQDIAKKTLREQMDHERLVAQNAETKAILDVQVDLFKVRVADEQHVKEKEDKELLVEWKRHAQIEAELEQSRRRQAIERAHDVKLFNKKRSDMSRREIEREREYDKQLLELSLRQEAQTEKRERDLQEKFKQDQLEYQTMLRKQIETEEEDLSHLDAIRKKMEDEVWQKRDAEHDEEQRAREELLAQVLKSRQEQIHRKTHLKKQAIQDDAAFMRMVQKEVDEALQKELEEQEIRKAEARKNQADILHQKQLKLQQEEKEKQREFLEMKRMTMTEKLHQKKLHALSQVERNANYRRKTAEWYFDT